MWNFGVAMTNAYIIYKMVMERDRAKALEHKDFILSCARNLMNSVPVVKKRKRGGEADPNSNPPNKAASVKAAYMTTKRLKSLEYNDGLTHHPLGAPTSERCQQCKRQRRAPLAAMPSPRTRKPGVTQSACGG